MKKDNKILKLLKARVREEAIGAGFADGRFKTKVVQDKRFKKPKYKQKFRNNEED